MCAQEKMARYHIHASWIHGIHDVSPPGSSCFGKTPPLNWRRRGGARRGGRVDPVCAINSRSGTIHACAYDIMSSPGSCCFGRTPPLNWRHSKGDARRRERSTLQVYYSMTQDKTCLYGLMSWKAPPLT